MCWHRLRITVSTPPSLRKLWRKATFRGLLVVPLVLVGWKGEERREGEEGEGLVEGGDGAAWGEMERRERKRRSRAGKRGGQRRTCGDGISVVQRCLL
jgi:hypothetical protein